MENELRAVDIEPSAFKVRYIKNRRGRILKDFQHLLQIIAVDFHRASRARRDFTE